MHTLYDWQTAGDFSEVVSPTSPPERVYDRATPKRCGKVSRTDRETMQMLVQWDDGGLEWRDIDHLGAIPPGDPCPYCGAESNIRCCEFGRDR